MVYLALLSSLLLKLLWIAFAIPSAIAGTIFVFHDESHIPAPMWLSEDEARQIVRRLNLYGGLALALLAIGVGGAFKSFGWDGFIVAGDFFVFGVTAGYGWVFLSSRLLGCPSCRGLTVHRAARGMWICLRCRHATQG